MTKHMIVWVQGRPRPWRFPRHLTGFGQRLARGRGAEEGGGREQGDLHLLALALYRPSGTRLRPDMWKVRSGVGAGERRVGQLHAQLTHASKQRWLETNIASDVRIEGVVEECRRLRRLLDGKLSRLIASDLFIRSAVGRRSATPSAIWHWRALSPGDHERQTHRRDRPDYGLPSYLTRGSARQELMHPATLDGLRSGSVRFFAQTLPVST